MHMIQSETPLPVTPEIIVVGGLASKVTNLLPLVSLGERFGNGDFQSVHGAHYTESDELVASTPSYQACELEAIVENSPKTDFLIIAHSIGVLAAVKTAEHNIDRVKVLAVAPTLPDPVSAHQHPHVQSKIQRKNGIDFMPSYSFALGDAGPSATAPTAKARVRIPEEYDSEIATYSDSILPRVIVAASNNRMRIVVPRNDWNKELLRTAHNIPGAIYVDSEHSLQGSPQEIDERTVHIAQTVASDLKFAL